MSNESKLVGVKSEMFLALVKYCAQEDNFSQLEKHLADQKLDQIVIGQNFAEIIKTFLLEGNHSERSDTANAAIKCHCGPPKAW
jgi:hypothetical protein